MSHPAVVQLRKRLQATGDLQAYGGYPEIYNSYVENAVKKAQARHGLPATGFLDKATIEELNVPVAARLRQLRTNLARLMSLSANIPAGKYVVVNIPSVQIEAINNNQVVSRHTGVVGKPDRPSPLVNSAIEEINFNKDWFVPPTVLKSDLIPKGREAQGKGAGCAGGAQDRCVCRFRGLSERPEDRPDVDRLELGRPAALFLRTEWRPGKSARLRKAQLSKPPSRLHARYVRPQHFLAKLPGRKLGLRARAERPPARGLASGGQWLDRSAGAAHEANRRAAQYPPQEEGSAVLDLCHGLGNADGTVQFRRDIYRRDTVDAVASAE